MRTPARFPFLIPLMLGIPVRPADTVLGERIEAAKAKRARRAAKKAGRP